MATMIRRNPIREMIAFQNALDRAYAAPRQANGTAEPTYTLPVDVYETDAAYTFVASLPGVGAENIHVTWNDDVVTVEAELPQGAPNAEHQRARLVERTAGKFSRSLRLSKPVHTEAVEAVYVDGVLTLTLPKAPEAQPRMIPVRSMPSAN